MNQMPKCVPRIKPNEDDTRENLLKLQEASAFIGRNIVTLYRWFDWYHDDRYEKPVDIPTPPNIIQAGRRKPMYIRKSELTRLLRFKAYITLKRPMGEYSNRFLSKDQQKKLLPQTRAKKRPPRYVSAEIYYAQLAEEAKRIRIENERIKAEREKRKEERNVTKD
jgi:hypothetical protein